MNYQRFHGLDALRGLAMVLGIVLHAALPYVPRLEMFWPSNDKSSSPITIIFQFIHMWRMPLFFILAGFFARLLIDRKTWKKWISNRLIRIGAPILIFSPVMLFTLPWIYMYGWTGKININFSMDGYPHHLWFLWHLLIFVLVSGAYYCSITGSVLLFSRLGFKLNKIRLPVTIIDFFDFLNKIIFLQKSPLILIFLITFLILFSGGELILNPFASSAYFLFGYSLYKDEGYFKFIVSNWKKYLLIGLVISCLFLILENFSHSNLNYRLSPQELNDFQDLMWLANQPIKVSGAIFISIGLIGLFESQLRGFNSIGRFLSDSAYWMYLIHLPVVNFVSFYMFQFDVIPEIKFLISIFITLFITLITYKIFVRSTYLGILLNGRKYPFKKTLQH